MQPEITKTDVQALYSARMARGFIIAVVSMFVAFTPLWGPLHEAGHEYHIIKSGGSVHTRAWDGIIWNGPVTPDIMAGGYWYELAVLLSIVIVSSIFSIIRLQNGKPPHLIGVAFGSGALLGTLIQIPNSGDMERLVSMMGPRAYEHLFGPFWWVFILAGCLLPFVLNQARWIGKIQTAPNPQPLCAEE